MGGGASKRRIDTIGSFKTEARKKVNRVPLALADKAAIQMQRIVRGFIVRRRIVALLDERSVKEKESWQQQQHSNSQLRTSAGVSSSGGGGYQDYSTATNPLLKYRRFGDKGVIIYPILGFVVKSKAVDTGRKIFLNIAHHEAVPTMAQTPARLLDHRSLDADDIRAATSPMKTSTSVATTAAAAASGRSKAAATAATNSCINGDSADAESEALVPFIIDVVVPSKEFNALFEYSPAEERLLPLSAAVKPQLAQQAIRFWNSQSDHYEISADFSLPKIRRGYFGQLQALILDTSSKYLNYLPPPVSRADLHPPQQQQQQQAGVSSSRQQREQHRENSFHFELPPSFCGWCQMPTFRINSLPPITTTATAATNAVAAVMRLELAASAVGNGHSVRLLMRSSKRTFDRSVKKQKEVSCFLPKPFQSQLPLYRPAYASVIAATAGSGDSGSGKQTAGLPAAVSRSAAASRAAATAAPILSPSVRPAPPPLSMKPSSSRSTSTTTATTTATATSAATKTTVSPVQQRPTGGRRLLGAGNLSSAGAIPEGDEDELSVEFSSGDRTIISAKSEVRAAAAVTAPMSSSRTKDDNSFGRNFMKSMLGQKAVGATAAAAASSPVRSLRSPRAGDFALSSPAASIQEDGTSPLPQQQQQFSFATAAATAAEVDSDICGFGDADGFSSSGPWDSVENLLSCAQQQSAEVDITLPVFLQLYNGVLRVFNRDPTGQTRPVVNAADLHGTEFSPKLLQAQYDQCASQPLQLLARVLLTATAVSSTSLALPQPQLSKAAADATNMSLRSVFLLHFHAPDAANADSSVASTAAAVATGAAADAATQKKSAVAAALASSYPHFSEALLCNSCSIVCSGFSQLLTWKALLREHITFSENVRNRVANYSSSTVVNKQFISVPPKQLIKKVTYMRPSVGADNSSISSSSGQMNVIMRVKEGILELLDATPAAMALISGHSSNSSSSSSAATTTEDATAQLPVVRSMNLVDKSVRPRRVRWVRVGERAIGGLDWRDDLLQQQRLQNVSATSPRSPMMAAASTALSSKSAVSSTSNALSSSGSNSRLPPPLILDPNRLQHQQSMDSADNNEVAAAGVVNQHHVPLERVIYKDAIVLQIRAEGSSRKQQEEMCEIAYEETETSTQRSKLAAAARSDQPVISSRASLLLPQLNIADSTASATDGIDQPATASGRLSPQPAAEKHHKATDQAKVAASTAAANAGIATVTTVLREHALFAASRRDLYLLPLLESDHDALVDGSATKIAQVQLQVSASADIDSDDDDDDEVEDALRKFTLQSVLYMARPTSHFRSAEAAEVESGLFNLDSDDEEDAAAKAAAVKQRQEKAQAQLQQEQQQDPMYFSSKTPLNQLSDNARLERIRNQLAVSEILASTQVNAIQRGDYSAVIAGGMLYLFHSERSFLALNISRCVDRATFYLTSNSMQQQVQLLKQQQEEERRRKQNKQSLFFIDSDDDSDDSDDASAGGQQSPLANKLLGVDTGGKKAHGASSGIGLPPSVAPPDFPVRRWVVKLVCYDGKNYELGFQDEDTYQDWRRALFQGGISLIDEHPNYFPSDLIDKNSDAAKAVAGSSSGGSRDTDAVRSSASIAEALGMRNPLLLPDAEATKKYYRVLRRDEKAICVGAVFKLDKLGTTAASSTTHKQKRVLLLTDSPRLIFIDTIGSIVRGHIELTKDAKPEVKMFTIVDFEVTAGGVVNRFSSCELPEKSSMYWLSRIKAACGI